MHGRPSDWVEAQQTADVLGGLALAGERMLNNAHPR